MTISVLYDNKYNYEPSHNYYIGESSVNPLSTANLWATLEVPADIVTANESLDIFLTIGDTIYQGNLREIISTAEALKTHEAELEAEIFALLTSTIFTDETGSTTLNFNENGTGAQTIHFMGTGTDYSYRWEMLGADEIKIVLDSNYTVTTWTITHSDSSIQLSNANSIYLPIN